MMKILLESRTELRIVDLSDVLYLQASHNYTDFMFADGRSKSELMNLSVLETQIKEMVTKQGITNPFVRVGRSLLVNTSYIEILSLKLKKIIFKTTPPTSITVSIPLLRTLKKTLIQRLD
jgi:DNA-binding LytR/AlgR family response regulator